MKRLMKRILKKRAVRIILLLLIGLLTLIGLYKQTMRGKILTSIIYFSEHTLNDRDYIAYDIDIMELCREYLNKDVTFSGRAYLNDISNFGFSSSMDVSGKRSFAQKRMVMNADLDVLFLNVGEIDFYAEDDTTYMIAPIIGDLSYGFQLRSSLFNQAPKFTADLSQEWMHDHMKDIWDFVNDIRIEETGETIEDEDGRISTEYRITIPAGSGAFIYELLGTETPDFDMVADLYLTPAGHFRRLEVDLDNIMADTVMVVDGTEVSQIIFTKAMPDDEQMVTTFTRNGNYTYTNVIAFESDYYTYKGSTIQATGNINWNHVENGINLDISEIEVRKDDELQLSAYFEGSLMKTEITEDLFADVRETMLTIDLLDWAEIRDDMKGFADEVMEKAKETVW